MSKYQDSYEAGRRGDPNAARNAAYYQGQAQTKYLKDLNAGKYTTLDKVYTNPGPEVFHTGDLPRGSGSSSSSSGFWSGLKKLILTVCFGFLAFIALGIFLASRDKRTGETVSHSEVTQVDSAPTPVTPKSTPSHMSPVEPSTGSLRPLVRGESVNSVLEDMQIASRYRTHLDNGGLRLFYETYEGGQVSYQLDEMDLARTEFTERTYAVPCKDNLACVAEFAKDSEGVLRPKQQFSVVTFTRQNEAWRNRQFLDDLGKLQAMMHDAQR